MPANTKVRTSGLPAYRPLSFTGKLDFCNSWKLQKLRWPRHVDGFAAQMNSHVNNTPSSGKLEPSNTSSTSDLKVLWERTRAREGGQLCTPRFCFGGRVPVTSCYNMSCMPLPNNPLWAALACFKLYPNSYPHGKMLWHQQFSEHEASQSPKLHLKLERSHQRTGMPWPYYLQSTETSVHETTLGWWLMIDSWKSRSQINQLVVILQGLCSNRSRG